MNNSKATKQKKIKLAPLTASEKTALKSLPVANIFEDGVFEPVPGCFSKMYHLALTDELPQLLSHTENKCDIQFFAISYKKTEEETKSSVVADKWDIYKDVPMYQALYGVVLHTGKTTIDNARAMFAETESVIKNIITPMCLSEVISNLHFVFNPDIPAAVNNEVSLDGIKTKKISKRNRK